MATYPHPEDVAPKQLTPHVAHGVWGSTRMATGKHRETGPVASDLTLPHPTGSFVPQPLPQNYCPDTQVPFM